MFRDPLVVGRSLLASRDVCSEAKAPHFTLAGNGRRSRPGSQATSDGNEDHRPVLAEPRTLKAPENCETEPESPLGPLRACESMKPGDERSGSTPSGGSNPLCGASLVASIQGRGQRVHGHHVTAVRDDDVRSIPHLDRPSCRAWFLSR